MGQVVPGTFQRSKETEFFSIMGRELISVLVEIDGMNVYLGTSHLESEKPNTKKRTDQLEYCLKEMSEKAEFAQLALFGGDLNLRDNEYKEAVKRQDAKILSANSPTEV